MILFTDIDDTLIFTKRKLQSTEGMDTGAISKMGEPSSFFPDKNKKFLNIFQGNTLIPVTARTQTQFKNVLIPFEHEKILSFGGVILNKDNTINKNWDLKIKSLSKNSLLFLTFVQSQLKTEFNNFYSQYKIVEDNDIPLYLIIRGNTLLEAKNFISNLLILKNETTNFYFHETDIDLVLLPSCISKEQAVMYLKQNNYPTDITIGMGDSITDYPFISLCDFHIIPNHSFLSNFLKSKTK